MRRDRDMGVVAAWSQPSRLAASAISPAPRRAAASWGPVLKVIEVTNTDFALRHFLLPLMRGLRARGHEAIGVCPDGPLVEAVREQGFRVDVLPLSRSLSPGAQWRALRALHRLFRAERPDVVHAHMPISGVLARFAARAAGVRRIAYTCHGFLFNQPGPLARQAASLALETLAARVTDVFMTVSTKEAVDAARLGISRRAIAVGNGRSPAVFHPNPAARATIRAALGTPSQRVVVAIVSRLVRSKGHAELLEAMRRVDAELWVVGERLASDHEESLEPYFAAAGLGARLRRLGYRDDIADLLAAADIFALPSWYEALPMSVIEAMLCALPVVASDIPGPREQVIHGVTGLLVPARDPAALAAALGRLAGDPGLRGRLGLAGLERARALYDETQVVGRVLDLLGA